MSVILLKEDGVPSPHLLRVYDSSAAYSSGFFAVSRPGAAELAHLLYMDTTITPSTDPGSPPLQLIEQCLSLSELCAHLQVSVQTIYDLRSQGRGRELRLWISEIEAWLARMEQDDDQRHALGTR